MIRVVIIEDEESIADYIIESLREIEPDIVLVSRLCTVKASIAFFAQKERVDLVFCDVQLEDGLSFQIFEAVEVAAPIVFVTGYDSFVLQALENNGIDYLLKPVALEDLEKAVRKYKSLESHFSHRATHAGISAINGLLRQQYKKRILVKKGVEHLPLLLEDIVLFFTENKVVFAIDNNSKKYIVDKTLNDLEEELSGQNFFRANRQYLLNIAYIKSFKPYERVKLWVELNAPNLDHTIVVSQITSPSFKKWLERS